MGKSLEAQVIIEAPPDSRALLQSFAPSELCELFIVSGISVAEGQTLSVRVASAEGGKCARCWRVLPTAGAGAKFPSVCDRCAEVLDSIGYAR